MPYDCWVVHRESKRIVAGPFDWDRSANDWVRATPVPDVFLVTDLPGLRRLGIAVPGDPGVKRALAANSSLARLWFERLDAIAAREGVDASDTIYLRRFFLLTEEEAREVIAAWQKERGGRG